jgi:16S rRNA (guanine527-N7)-methyltransferase
MSDVVQPEQHFCAAMADLGCAVTEAALRRLKAHEHCLRTWQAHTNLVGPSTLEQLWTRHYLDCGQLLPVAGAQGETATWLDMGAGAGLPGLVLVALGVPSVTLVDSIAKKCRFLTEAASAMGCSAQTVIKNARLESLSPSFTQFITARACAPLVRLLSWGYPFSRETTRWLLLKGQDVDAEVTEAARHWTFDLQMHSSISDSRGRLIELRGVRPRSPAGRRR